MHKRRKSSTMPEMPNRTAAYVSMWRTSDDLFKINAGFVSNLRLVWEPPSSGRRWNAQLLRTLRTTAQTHLLWCSQQHRPNHRREEWQVQPKEGSWIRVRVVVGFVWMSFGGRGTNCLPLQHRLDGGNLTAGTSPPSEGSTVSGPAASAHCLPLKHRLDGGDITAQRGQHCV